MKQFLSQKTTSNGILRGSAEAGVPHRRHTFNFRIQHVRLLELVLLVLACASVPLPAPSLAAPSYWRDDFSAPAVDTARWQISSWVNGDPTFLTDWINDQWHVQPDAAAGRLRFHLDTEGCPAGCEGKAYASGEISTRNAEYLYGVYEASIKASPASGSVTTFFLYGDTGGSNPQRVHEVDWEIYGNWDGARVGYFDGTSQCYKDIAIPDPHGSYHLYKIVITPSGFIGWYMDGALKAQIWGGTCRQSEGWTASGPLGYNLGFPDTNMKLYLNFWVGDNTRWPELGSRPGGGPHTASYDYVLFSPNY